MEAFKVYADVPGLTEHELASLDDIDMAEAGRQFREERDAGAWKLGDLVCEFYERYPEAPRRGRPPASYDGPTLATLSEAWGMSVQRVSEMRLNASLYPLRFRRLDDYMSYAHYDAARRAVCPKGDTSWAEDEHWRSVLLLNAMRLVRLARQERLGIDDFRASLRGAPAKPQTVYAGGWPEGEPVPSWLWVLTRGKPFSVTVRVE